MFNLRIFQNRATFLFVPVLLSVGLLIAACTVVAVTPIPEEPGPSPIVLSSDDNLVLAPITAVDMADTGDVFLLVPASRLPEEQLPEDLDVSAITSIVVLVPFDIVDSPPGDIMALVPQDKVQREVEGRPIFTGDLQPRRPITLTPDVKLFITVEDLVITASDGSVVTPLNAEVAEGFLTPTPASAPTPMVSITSSITSSALSLFTSSNVLVTGYDPATFPEENRFAGFTLGLPDLDDFCPECDCEDVCRMGGCCGLFCCWLSEGPEIEFEFPGPVPDIPDIPE